MSTTTPDAQNEAALRRAVERWNAGDLAGYLEVYADDVRVHGFGPEPMDKPAVRAFYEGMFAAFTESRLELHETFSSGDRLNPLHSDRSARRGVHGCRRNRQADRVARHHDHAFS